ncbi:MAG: hypothetical protein V4717_23460 [Bacteroidota bacterium]
MIGIRENIKDLDKIKIKHLTFVGGRVERVIQFYIDIFNLLKSIDRFPRTLNTTINKAITDSRKKHKLLDYKQLIKVLLKPNRKYENLGQLYKVKYSDNRIDAAKNNISRTVSKLQSLLIVYRKILALDFEDDAPHTIQFYSNLQLEYGQINFLLENIFDYDNWFSKLDLNDDWGPYQLTSALNQNTCPFCNRQYTFTIMTIDGAKVARPQLDHFLPKSLNPLLGLSFFNLIPSCGVCNSSIKSSKPTSFNTHLNPYEKNEFNGLMRFSYTPLTYEGSIGLTSEVDVEIRYDGLPTDKLLEKKIQGNIEMFCLNDVYKNHTDAVQEIIRKRHISNDKYIESIQTMYNHLNLSLEETYRLAYGNYYNEKEHFKRPLAKLTRDIAVELGAIFPFPKK